MLLSSCWAMPSLAQEAAPTEQPSSATDTEESSTKSEPRVQKRLIKLSPDAAPPSSVIESDPTPEHQPVVPVGPPLEAAGAEDAPDDDPFLLLFLSLIVVGIALFVAERVRAWVSVNVPLRRVMAAIVVILRLAALALVLSIILELLPAGQDWILWGLAILVVVVGWSVRDLFADMVAGAVLSGERRVRKGMWVSGDGFQGTVEGRSLRATWLRDGQGHRLTVPNRAMVAAPMVYDAGAEAEHEVVVRLEGYDDASRVRSALNDAILSSPWVLAGAVPVVLRDPADPVVWRVRSKLLEPRFSVHFEGELLERVEDLLRYDPAQSDRDTTPAEPRDTSPSK